MYRYTKQTDAPVRDFEYLVYNFEADSKDCYLISENQRKFGVLRAPKNGKGRGMGQRSIWYAESEYAQDELIPNFKLYRKL